MRSKSDNIEIMINDEANEVIKLFDSLKSRYQNNLESMKGSELALYYVHVLYYQCHKINSNRGAPHKATINRHIRRVWDPGPWNWVFSKFSHFSLKPAVYEWIHMLSALCLFCMFLITLSWSMYTFNLSQFLQKLPPCSCYEVFRFPTKPVTIARSHIKSSENDLNWWK